MWVQAVTSSMDAIELAMQREGIDEHFIQSLIGEATQNETISQLMQMWHQSKDTEHRNEMLEDMELILLGDDRIPQVPLSLYYNI